MSAKRIAELLETLRLTNDELDALRKQCAHDGPYFIGNWSWRVGSWSTKRICTLCKMPCGEPTSEEIERWRSFA